MATFPGDMSIGWGFGLEPQEEITIGTPEEAERVAMSLTDEDIERLEEEQKTYDFRDEPECAPDGYQPTDPLLAVSELEQRVEMLEGMLKTYFAEAPSKRIFSLEQRVTDLEERLRSLVFVVNTLCSSMHDIMHQGKE